MSAVVKKVLYGLNVTIRTRERELPKSPHIAKKERDSEHDTNVTNTTDPFEQTLKDLSDKYGLKVKRRSALKGVISVNNISQTNANPVPFQQNIHDRGVDAFDHDESALLQSLLGNNPLPVGTLVNPKLYQKPQTEELEPYKHLQPTSDSFEVVNVNSEVVSDSFEVVNVNSEILSDSFEVLEDAPGSRGTRTPESPNGIGRNMTPIRFQEQTTTPEKDSTTSTKPIRTKLIEFFGPEFKKVWRLFRR